MVAGRGIALLRQAGIHVQTAILADECRRLIAPFAKHVTTGRPLVILKSALTLDGRSATVTGDSRWITGAESRALVHRLRDKCDAIMVGIGTVLHDDPQLTCRLPEGDGRDPLRIIVDARLDIPMSAAVLAGPAAQGTLLAVTAAAGKDKARQLEERGATVLVCAETAGRVDLGDLLNRLGARGVQSVLVEGGAILNQSLLSAGLVDQVMIFFAPKLLGGSDGKGMFSGAGVRTLAAAVQLQDVRVSRCGEDVLIEGEVLRCSPD